MTDAYRVKIDRRTSLKWLTSAAAVLASGCYNPASPAVVRPAKAGSEPVLGNAGFDAAVGPGYGTDPDLSHPEVPWPRIMTQAQLRLSAVLSDMIIPEDERSPSASAVGVPDFVDEWISAPYPVQKTDRKTIEEGLSWLQGESNRRFDRNFELLEDIQRRSILDEIAFVKNTVPEFTNAAEFFRRFRYLVVGAFFTTPTGMADIGYSGNRPIIGEYPGPSDAALRHLEGALRSVGLSMPPLS